MGENRDFPAIVYRINISGIFTQEFADKSLGSLPFIIGNGDGDRMFPGLYHHFGKRCKIQNGFSLPTRSSPGRKVFSEHCFKPGYDSLVTCYVQGLRCNFKDIHKIRQLRVQPT